MFSAVRLFGEATTVYKFRKYLQSSFDKVKMLHTRMALVFD